MLSRVVDKTTDVADLVAVVGAVVGHVKACIKCPAGKANVSVVLTSSPVITKQSHWMGDVPIDECELTIDVLSLVNTDAPVEEYVEEWLY